MPASNLLPDDQAIVFSHIGGRYQQSVANTKVAAAGAFCCVQLPPIAR
jgi:hypothetical protein